ncbi:MAG TPA: DEAD/DEAH box helicase [Gammaproteobacteria bacterium]|jgi:ATP-dependent RNA helicase DeaD
MQPKAPLSDISFKDLGLNDAVLKALVDVGYETPSPIQAKTIPHVLAGRDVLGQAQTGTGKTAAFALPLLSKLDLKNAAPQVLVLTPTRELAIQVAEAFQKYAAHMKGFHVLPIYGGQDYYSQLQQLRRGPHVVVGTPGRVMDHIRKNTLQLLSLQCLVLDEADEMLRMGFIDDVEWILDQTPSEHQIALFSATMPPAIRRIAQKYLNAPETISIENRTTTAENIRQRYWLVSGTHKLDALTRILESETFDAMLIFVRTKTATVELAERLEARGYAAAALSGDVVQKMREKTVQRLKDGNLDILVATDVAARGLDVERVSHVVNYDIPYDTEAYVHRIGRTGRAGRQGDAILFVAPREQRMLRAIEQATRQPITQMQLPSTEIINDKRIAKFHQKITDTLAAGELQLYQELIERFQQAHNVPALEIAAALAKLAQGSTPLLLKPQVETPVRDAPRERHERQGYESPRRGRDRSPGARGPLRPARGDGVAETGMETFRLEVGLSHGAKPGNIVGAIANEAGIEGRLIGRIRLYDEYSTVDLPEGMPADIFNGLKKTRVAGRPLSISRAGAAAQEAPAAEAPVKHRSVERPPGTSKRKNKNKNKFKKPKE